VEAGKIDDAVIVSLLLRCRLAGFDAYVLPQGPDLPMANRREDVLIVLCWLCFFFTRWITNGEPARGRADRQTLSFHDRLSEKRRRNFFQAGPLWIRTI
jgi:hypothetical protein